MGRTRIGQVTIPAAIVAIIVMMVVPLPAVVLDLLIVVNISFAVITLLCAMYVQRPLDFSIFPSFLLIATLFRLSLNIAATRLILLHGNAGKVIESFGHFVVGGSIIVGLVIFLILIVIQFVVITNGAGRVAEVGARFTLDAMPGKQMAIDADLNAGIIGEEEARARRKEVADEADFYGAMDGASKFVKGDAIAAIVIVMINMIGGLAVGILQRHMPIGEAVSTYSLLTVGDGLVSQIPALLISMAAGLIVTRSATQDDLGTDMLAQFTRHHRALQIAGGSVCVLALFPGLPKLPFLLVGGAVLIVASRVANREVAEPEGAAEPAEAEVAPDSPESIAEAIHVEPLEVQLAYDLVELVDPAVGGDLLGRVKALRRKVAGELGIVIPLVRTRDNVDLPVNAYSIRVHGVEAGRGEAPPGTFLVIGDDLDALPGRPTREPVFGLPAKWIPADLRVQAELAGATVVDRASVITTHLSEIAREHAHRLLSRQDVKDLVDLVKRSDPVVTDELTASGLTLGEVQAVLQNLLEEGVAVRDLVRICEVLSERARITRDPVVLTEACRTVLGPAIASAHTAHGVLPVIGLDPRCEQTLLEHLVAGEGGGSLAVDPELLERILAEVARVTTEAEQLGHQPVLVCSAPLRVPLRRLVQASLPRLSVLAYPELGGQLRIETVGIVDVGLHANV